MYMYIYIYAYTHTHVYVCFRGGRAERPRPRPPPLSGPELPRGAARWRCALEAGSASLSLSLSLSLYIYIYIYIYTYIHIHICIYNISHRTLAFVGPNSVRRRESVSARPSRGLSSEIGFSVPWRMDAAAVSTKILHFVWPSCSCARSAHDLH